MLLSDDLQQPQLAISTAGQNRCWYSSSAFARPEHRWNHYLNQLMLDVLLPWIKDESQGIPLFQDVAPAQVWPDAAAAAQLWQWVNGTAIALGSSRFILIPTDSLDGTAFYIPQEWVEIPSWRGDYYLMVQLNPEAERLQLRGYVSHAQLLKHGVYCQGDRSYAIDESALVQDADVLWVMAQIESAEERCAVLAPVPELPRQQAESLIQVIAQQWERSCQGLTSLRLQLPFPQWAALLEQEPWRNLLHAALADANVLPTPLTQLSQWFQGQFDAVWRSPDQLLASPSLAPSLRQIPAQSISRGKAIVFQGGLPPLALWTTIAAKTDDRMEILVQLRHQSSSPDGFGRPLLPSGLKLILLSPAEESLQVVTAGERDDYIQLPRFKVFSGQAFSVEIRWQDQVIREQFLA
jgi:hypothetical protein